MTKRVFSFLSLLVLSCAAGAAARAQAPAPCEPQLPSDPAFWADMKEMPAAGRFSYSFDKRQFDDPSAPVVVRMLSAVTSLKVRGGKLRCAQIENRSRQTVKAIQLGWAVTARGDAEKVLARGRLPLIRVEVPPGGRQKVEPQEAHFADFLRPLVRDGVLEGDYDLHVGVARAEFADGTVADTADEP